MKIMSPYACGNIWLDGDKFDKDANINTEYNR